MLLEPKDRSGGEKGNMAEKSDQERNDLFLETRRATVEETRKFLAALSLIEERRLFQVKFHFETFEEFFLEHVGTEKAWEIYKKMANGPFTDDELVEFAGEHYFHEMAKKGNSKPESDKAPDRISATGGIAVRTRLKS